MARAKCEGVAKGWGSSIRCSYHHRDIHHYAGEKLGCTTIYLLPILIVLAPIYKLSNAFKNIHNQVRANN